ncbi:MAG: hypothetical protein ACJA1C_001988 [Crocinitomicaceae bacterium]|jgi:hypothetical protein
MRYLVAICLLFAGNIFAQSSEKVQDKWTWASLDIGYGYNPNYNVFITSASLTHTLSIHEFDLKFRSAREIVPKSNTIYIFSSPPPTLDPDIFRTFNFQYGVSLTKEHIRFNAGVGLGYSFGKHEVVLSLEEEESFGVDYNYYNENGGKVKLEIFNTLNFPIDLDFQFLLGKNFGIEINGFVDFNAIMPNYGGTFGVVFGKLR